MAAYTSPWQQKYDPSKVTGIRVLEDGDAAFSDKAANIACAYNPSKVMHSVVRPVPTIGPLEALVRVRATGICGSDVHFWRHGRIGTSIVEDEVIAGHESAGEVIAIGGAVRGLAVGDRVAIEAGIPCGQAGCVSCLTGDYKACPAMVFHSSPPFHGTMCRFLAHPAAWLHKLPRNMSFEDGALCEPLSVALAGVEKAGVRLGQSVLICGAGPIGLLTLMSADAAGATPLIITDLSEDRLKLAKELIPQARTVLVNRSWIPSEIATEVKKVAGESIDLSIECTGFESSIEAAIYCVKFGSKVMVIGVGPARQTYPFGYCALNQIDVQFLFRYSHQYPKALKLVSSGKLDLKPLVTHRFALERAIEAFDTAGDPAKGAMKVLVVDNE